MGKVFNGERFAPDEDPFNALHAASLVAYGGGRRIAANVNFLANRSWGPGNIKTGVECRKLV